MLIYLRYLAKVGVDSLWIPSSFCMCVETSREAKGYLLSQQVDSHSGDFMGLTKPIFLESAHATLRGGGLTLIVKKVNSVLKIEPKEKALRLQQVFFMI